MKLSILLIACMTLIYSLSVRNKHVSKTAGIDRHNLLVQGFLNLPVLKSIKNQTGIVVNNIIKTELGLDTSYDFNFFLTKQKQRLTLYYLNLTDVDASATLIYPAVDKFFQDNKATLQSLKQVNLLPNLNLFGEHHDELVIMVNDPEKELARLNQTLKKQMYQINAAYQGKYNANLYDIAKSEKFSYLPHIGLGRIRTTSIKQHIKDTAQEESIYDHINQRILQEVSLVVVSHLARQNKALQFESLCINDSKLKTCVKQYLLT